MAAITIRNVPDETRDELASRAARSGRSLQEYLRRELIALAEQETNETVMARVIERKKRTNSRLSVEKILEYRDADRR